MPCVRFADRLWRFTRSLYLLAAAIVLHLVAVVVTEVHEGGSITSAMFTGRKIFTRRPPDAP